jgi:hypothetical protein
MAFWRFGFAQDSGIDGLLKNWNGSSSSSGDSSEAGIVDANGQHPPAGNGGEGQLSTSSSGSSIQLASTSDTAGSVTLNGQPSPTLEQLLEEEDLLQECKAGHAKLVSDTQ